MKKSIIKEFFISILKWLFIVFMAICFVVVFRYIVGEIFIHNNFSSFITTQQDLPGIPRKSVIKIRSNGTILINDKIPTQEQWDSLKKQTKHWEKSILDFIN
jgi:hypothetical protein